MNVIKRIEKIESQIVPKGKSKNRKWFDKHMPEISAEMDRLWEAFLSDVDRFLELLQGGQAAYDPLGWWVRAAPGVGADDVKLIGEFHGAMREYFVGFDPAGCYYHKQADEDWPADTEKLIAFFQEHGQPIGANVCLERWRKSEIFQKFMAL
jgi:hypothetical protein